MRPSAVAPLMYLLAIVSGLAGLTIVRWGEDTLLAAVWFGAIVGTGTGLLLAIARVRLWVIAVAALALLPVGPIAFIILEVVFGRQVETMLFALLPAILCGYAVFTERGGLVAFWYPTMLWTALLLDGTSISVPITIALGAAFVTFFHARESRRVALWASEGSVRLARTKPGEVLRIAPVRGLLHAAWPAVVGFGALALAVVVAPHLWAKDPAHRAPTATPIGALRWDESTNEACCPEPDKSEHVREYLPLTRDESAGTFACSKWCVTAAPPIEVDDPWFYRGTPGAGLSIVGGSTEGTSYESVALEGWSPSPSMWTSTLPEPNAVPAPPSTSIAPAPVVVPPPIVAPPVVAPQAVAPAPKPVEAPKPVIVHHEGSSQRGLLGAVLVGIVLFAITRAARRAVTMRHLERPLWRETVDQQISNHWQRILIGLRDLGIRPGDAERPRALALRVGLPGMEQCAAILERARHGVRIDEDDRATMSREAGRVYRAARERAGTAARCVAWFRRPLA
jgi:hypothetical protein